MGTIRAAIGAIAVFLCVTGAVRSDDVSLRAHDGGLLIEGSLLGFDGRFLRIASQFGEVTVDGLAANCTGSGCPDLNGFVPQVAFSGAAGMGAVMLPALVESFARRSGFTAIRTPLGPERFRLDLLARNGGKVVARFLFRLTTTEEGFADLLAGEADIAMSLREVRDSENVRAKEAGLGDLLTPHRGHVLSLDALVPVVAPGNPVRRITLPILAEVFAGRIGNWRALGGHDAPIVLHVPEENSGRAQAIEDRLLAPLDLRSPTDAIRHPAVGPALAEAVTLDPNGIGIAGFGQTANARALVLAGTCGFSMSANRMTIKTEDFPLTSPMFLYLPARRFPKIIRDFMGFLRSPAAQIVIRRAGFVDQAPGAVSWNDQGNRLANAITAADGVEGLTRLQTMLETLRALSRLSVTFRFVPGTDRLDAQSQSNVTQLARALETGAFDARQLVFAGFGEGGGGQSLETARSRAAAVRSAVEAAADRADLDRLALRTVTFGAALPMACDNDSWGRQVNSRVEVWVR